MSQKVCESVFKAEVEAVLYPIEPLGECLTDPIVITAMTIHHPPHKSYIPVHPQTIYLKYVMFIDIERTTELIK